MKPNQTYKLAFSSCPNDTFIFKAIARQLIDLHGYCFDIVLEDVETLNQKAAKGTYDITKLSFAAFGSLVQTYALLRTGSALGLGCGPLIISLPGRSLDDKTKPVIAVPGMGTTAYHLFRLYVDDKYIDMDASIIPMPFEKIMPAVIERKADFGVIIHEGRFVYPDMGLELKADLGLWWEDKTFLPIPLGCIAIKRDIDSAIACDIQKLIGKSIDHAFLNPSMAYDYIQTYAQELDEDVIQQHIGLYVNNFSKDIGEKGEAAITTFFEKARASGLIEKSESSLFAC
ncbi:MAG: 1,4-dihydroxy-6-naphthoate synthase [Desulfobacula sp.]|uniref:menaquinone biosynthesis family protein n=2 Tax=Desulfobacula sp. TaxID=2593537 RepID=UPI002A0F5C88|nr:1,4-dihydroxy-6-naphthoate synthase [Desulfobacula sp.]MBT5973725.1 1,4-dihydroxy-6-naphthoate synthase [Desulfobacula sp.]